MQLFERLAEAEAAIHDTPIERVHLHEVGALDSIIDIVGAVYGVRVVRRRATSSSSPLNVGGGTVQCAHGVFPVPAPATARLLDGRACLRAAATTELVTPTGALLMTGYAREFGPLPAMRDRADRLRRWRPGSQGARRTSCGPARGETRRRGRGASGSCQIECEIDDMNPQLFGPLMDRLAEAGALDVFYAAVQMKKNRPGTLVTVVAPPERREAIAGVLFTHTTTIGVRYQEMLRETPRSRDACRSRRRSGRSGSRWRAATAGY